MTVNQTTTFPLNLSVCPSRPHLALLTLDRPQDDAMFDPLHHFIHSLRLHIITALAS